VQAFVHVTHQMLSQLSPHCSPNIVAYNYRHMGVDLHSNPFCGCIYLPKTHL